METVHDLLWITALYARDSVLCLFLFYLTIMFRGTLVDLNTDKVTHHLSVLHKMLCTKTHWKSSPQGSYYL